MEYLQEFKHRVKLPRLSARLIILANDTSLISFWLSLKSMYAGGSIHNFQKRWSEIANYTKYTQRLVHEKLASIEKEVLTLASKEAVIKRYNIKINSKYIKYNEYKQTQVKNLKLVIRAQAIDDKMHQIRKASQLQILRSQKEVKKNGKKVATAIKLGQQGIARVYGNKFRSNGNYWTNKLKGAGLLLSERVDPVLKLANVNFVMFRKIRNANPELPLYLKRDKVYQRQPNRIQIKLW
jgi:hypothetical protein